MILDADTYRVNLKPIKLMTEEKTQAERLEFIGVLALATGVPIVIVGYYLGELYGFTDELRAVIARLEEFYAIKEVLNVRSER